jgi:hypothetical protein
MKWRAMSVRPLLATSYHMILPKSELDDLATGELYLPVPNGRGRSRT